MLGIVLDLVLGGLVHQLLLGVVERVALRLD
jgi:hypothetical protein